MNWIYGIGLVVILCLAALGVYLGWAAYHEKGKAIVADAKKEVKDEVNKVL
jgi:hypothetical protein